MAQKKKKRFMPAASAKQIPFAVHSVLPPGSFQPPRPSGLSSHDNVNDRRRILSIVLNSDAVCAHAVIRPRHSREMVIVEMSTAPAFVTRHQRNYSSRVVVRCPACSPSIETYSHARHVINESRLCSRARCSHGQDRIDRQRTRTNAQPTIAAHTFTPVTCDRRPRTVHASTTRRKIYLRTVHQRHAFAFTLKRPKMPTIMSIRHTQR